MTHRIYFSVCGEGYGHSSRDIAIANVLTAGRADVLMGCYGYVHERLKTKFNVAEIEKEFEMVGSNGAFDLKATIFRSKKTALRFSKMITDEKKLIEDFGATCVVADGRTAAVFAAFKLGLPCIMISNQTSLEPFFKEANFLIRLIGKPVELTAKTLTTITEITIIPDFPPPDTVCIESLSRDRHIMKKQTFVGPVVSMGREGDRNTPQDIRSPFVLTLLGGHLFRRPIFEGILKIADRFPEACFLIFTPFKSDLVPPNVTIREFAVDISSYMQVADLIITQAGHSTAMEILTLGKPALIIPDKGQIEQENNALRMKELGVSETLDYASLKPQQIFEKINILLSNKSYKKKAEVYSIRARTMNGAKRSADIILELSERIQCY
jgi:UDP-N-acetylglucosamine--N-acetylmuramyl-(pentapeptide) pyrophosphoryl-undecaprenol N-acetylglucosamine transferase